MKDFYSRILKQGLLFGICDFSIFKIYSEVVNISVGHPVDPCQEIIGIWFIFSFQTAEQPELPDLTAQLAEVQLAVVLSQLTEQLFGQFALQLAFLHDVQASLQLAVQQSE